MHALTKQLCYGLVRRSRQAHYHKLPHYPAIPYYYKPNFIDIHDTYTKRSMEEIRAELQDKQFDIEYERLLCSPGDFHKQQRQQKATAVLDITQLNFTEYQLERFKLLVGSRYTEGSTKIKFSCHMFPSFQANFEKLNEQIYEVIIEAKRAP